MSGFLCTRPAAHSNREASLESRRRVFAAPRTAARLRAPAPAPTVGPSDSTCAARGQRRPTSEAASRNHAFGPLPALGRGGSMPFGKLVLYLCILLGACAIDTAPSRNAAVSTNPFGNTPGAGAGAGAGVTTPVIVGDGCGGQAYEGKAAPLDIYIIMDESLSMIIPVDHLGTGHERAQPVLHQPRCGRHRRRHPVLLGRLRRRGVRHACRRRSPAARQRAAARRTCSPRACPGRARRPTPALQGAIMHARQRAMANPGTKTVVLLVTDGEPASCGATDRDHRRRCRRRLQRHAVDPDLRARPRQRRRPRPDGAGRRHRPRLRRSAIRARSRPWSTP